METDFFQKIEMMVLYVITSSISIKAPDFPAGFSFLHLRDEHLNMLIKLGGSVPVLYPFYTRSIPLRGTEPLQIPYIIVIDPLLFGEVLDRVLS